MPQPDGDPLKGGPCRGGLTRIGLVEHGGVVHWQSQYKLKPPAF